MALAKVAIVLATVFLVGTCSSRVRHVIELSPESPHDVPDCEGDNVSSCRRVSVDFRSLLSSEDGQTLHLVDGFAPFVRTGSTEEELDSRSFVFRAEDDSYAHLLYSERDGYPVVSGVIHKGKDNDGVEVRLANCLEDCHVVMDLDTKGLHFGHAGHNATEPEEEDERNLDPEVRALLAEGRQSSSVATYTVNLYYTREYAAAVSNPVQTLAAAVAVVNQGYRNTNNAPIRVRVLCTPLLLSNVNQNVNSGSALLSSFARSRGGTRQSILRGADTAALFISNPRAGLCGQAATIGATRNSRAWSISFAARNCPSIVLGHEIGHLIGLRHQTDPNGNYNHAFVLSNPAEVTVMGDGGTRATRINVYSNVEIRRNGRRMGNTFRANNLRTLRERRFIFANIGDENVSCGGGSSPTTTTTRRPPTCVDRSRLCFYVRIFGWCRSSLLRAFVTAICPRQCGFCR